MRVYIQLLLWIIFLYFLSWFYTGRRSESALVTVNRSLAKMLFYVKSSHGISVVSIIIGLFAHFSLIFFLILVLFKHATYPYMELIIRIWICLGISLACAGETIETCIKMKRAESLSKKKEFLALTILLIFVTGFMLCLTAIYCIKIKN